jgi:hypothetical protein
MGSKSKDKGSNHERDVADSLTAWFGKPFKRVPSSGALRWGVDSTWHYGDLLPPEGFNFTIEAKHWQSIVFDEILGRRTSKTKNNPSPQPSFGSGDVATFWFDQAVPDAARAAVELSRPIEALLVWKQDYARARICLGDHLYTAIDPQIRKQLVCCWTYIPDKSPFMTLDFELFLEKVSPLALQTAFSKLHPFP